VLDKFGREAVSFVHFAGFDGTIMEEGQLIRQYRETLLNKEESRYANQVNWL